MLTVSPKDVSIPKFHHYLTSSVGPRPIALASTIDEDGTPNLAPFSFFNVFGANPPTLVFSPARSGRTTQTKDTHENVKKIAECVINIVTHDMLEQINLCSSPYEISVNEFEKSGFTPIASEEVRPFRVKESPVQMECKVLQVIETGTGGAAGNLIICEIVKIHIDESILSDEVEGEIDQRKLDLIGRMGKNWWCRAKEGMFQLDQHDRYIAIGLDSLPKDVLNSSILTGRELAILAGVTELPNETDVNEYKLLELSELFISLEDEPAKLEIELHKIAKLHIENNELEEAWKTLLTFNNQ